MANEERDAALASIHKQLKAAGLKSKITTGLGNSGIEIAVQHSSPVQLRNMEHRVRATIGYKYELSGFTIRWDYAGRRGMGTTRYPIRKDGTIDIDRLKGDIDSFERREASRKEASDQRVANSEALAKLFAAIHKRAQKLSGASASGVYIEVENDGAAAGRIRFKISGHATPTLISNLLSALDYVEGDST